MHFWYRKSSRCCLHLYIYEEYFSISWDIRVLLLFLASFLQEPALLHGWIEHTLLPPDYMDLSGIYINSSVAARVCTKVQMKDAAHNSMRDTHLSKGQRRWEEGREVCYHVIDRLAICPCFSSSSLDDLCLLWKAHTDTHINRHRWSLICP